MIQTCWTTFDWPSQFGARLGRRQAGVGSGNENFDLEPGKCVEDIPTKRQKIEDDKAAWLSSSDAEDINTPKKEREKEKEKDKLEHIKSIKRRIATTPKVAEINATTVATSTKR